VFNRFLQVSHQNFGDEPAVGENDCGNLPLQERRRNVLRFLHVRAADSKLGIDDGRIVEEDVLFAFAGAAFTYELEWLPRQLLRELLWISDCRGRADELRAASVEFTNPRQAPKNIGHVTSENSAVSVQLIQDHELQILEKTRPPGVVRKNAFVKHVRITENDVPLRPHGHSRILRRISVIGVNTDITLKRIRPFHQVFELIVGQRFCGIQIQSPGIGVFHDALPDRQVVTKRLPRGCRRHDRDVLAAARQLKGAHLM
jgi:hypothetical protein